MNEIVDCPGCQRKLQLPSDLLGQDVQCPTCGKLFAARAGGGHYQPPAPPAPKPSRDWDDRRHDDEPPPRRRRYYDDDDDYGRSGRRGGYGGYRRDLMPHRGSTVMTLGILSLVACGLLGPVAWVMGNNDLAEMRAGRMDRDGESQTQAGRICGMITTIIMIAALAFYCLIFVMMIGAGGMR
jgi:hypothetical protein